MDTVFYLNFIGLSANIAGSIILAFSLSSYLTAIHGAIALHDLTIKGIINRDNLVLMPEGIDVLLKKGVNNGKVKTLIGLVFIVVGFILQFIPYLIKIIS